MKRALALTGALALLFVIGAPALAADETLPQTGRVLISIQGDVTLPAGEQADAVIVIQGNALIQGTANAVTVINGTATLDGARVETLAIIDGTATLLPGTNVVRDVIELDGTVNRSDGVTVGGTIRPMFEEMAGFALLLSAAALLLWVGTLLALLVAGLALAAFAARQVRTAEGIISGEPVKVFLVGLAMIIVPPIIAIGLAVTVLGLPLGLGLLLFVWPALAFLGYLVAAIWIGEWILRATGRTTVAERPYLGAIVGLIVAGIAGIVPIVTGIISIFGLGAVAVACWRTLTASRTPRPTLQASPAPVAG